MGRLSRRDRKLKRLTAQLSKLSESEQEAVEEKSDFTTMLVAAAMGGGSNYIELAPDGRELDASERAGALEQLRAGAIAILTTERRRDLVDQLEPNVPLPETLLLVRVLQQALILALSQDPAIRARALDARMMAHYLGLAQVLWKEHQERTGRWDD